MNLDSENNNLNLDDMFQMNLFFTFKKIFLKWLRITI